MNVQNTKKFNRKEWALFLASITLVSLAAVVVASPRGGDLEVPLEYAAINADLGKIKLAINVQAKDAAGNPKGSYCSGDDLIVENFRALLRNMFMDPHGSASDIDDFPPQPKNTAGANFGTNLWTTTVSSSSYFFYSSVAQGVGGFIGIGNGTGAASTADYSLGIQVGTYAGASSASYAAGNLTIAGTCTVTTTQNSGISEAGLFIRSNSAYLMVARDVFTAIPVSISDTVTITYTLVFNDTGFTDNFGEIMEALFTYYIGSGNLALSLIDINGNSKTTYLWTTASSWLFDVSAANQVNGNCGIMVGTSSYATNRTQFSLVAPIGSIVSTSLPVSYSNGLAGNVTWTSFIRIPAGATVTETGFFLKAQNTADVTFTYMVWRKTFSAVPVAPNGGITVTIQISS